MDNTLAFMATSIVFFRQHHRPFRMKQTIGQRAEKGEEEPKQPTIYIVTNAGLFLQLSRARQTYKFLVHRLRTSAFDIFVSE